MIRASKKPKIVKEFVNRQFKEVKKDNNGMVKEFAAEEEENDSRFASNSNFSSNGKRVAPVLNSNGQEQSLEQLAGTAPAPASSTSNAGTGQTAYAANYASKYDGARYENREQQIQPTSGTRAAGTLNPTGLNFQNLRTQNTWQSQQANSAWDTNMPEEKRYLPQADQLKDNVKEIDRRRRMF